MRAPTMIENAKKRSPTISQSAWKLPMPSPMRSNHPSVRTASSDISLGRGATAIDPSLGVFRSRDDPFPAPSRSLPLSLSFSLSATALFFFRRLSPSHDRPGLPMATHGHHAASVAA